jgi:hypothetical protein
MMRAAAPLMVRPDRSLFFPAAQNTLGAITTLGE